MGTLDVAEVPLDLQLHAQAVGVLLGRCHLAVTPLSQLNHHVYKASELQLSAQVLLQGHQGAGSEATRSH